MPNTTNAALDFLSINTIRALSIDAIDKANSGHPGLPLGAAPMAYVLWTKHLKHSPQNPRWADRDRFVLSAGHGSMLLYSLLHLTGYDLSLDELKRFRQWGSKTPGHPEFGLTPGVEATTGPLGQGFANAVGMAMAERKLAALFNRPGFEMVNHFTYTLVGDGCLMEGLTAEAASLAGHLKLGKLICLYDANSISLDGPISLTFTEDVAKRFEAHGWQVLTVADGNTDLNGIDGAIQMAKADLNRPSMIIVKTTIGYGSPNRAGTSGVHGSPLGKDENAATKKALGWPSSDAFHIPAEALETFRKAVSDGERLEADWNRKFQGYESAHPELAQQFKQAMSGSLPANWDWGTAGFKAGDKGPTRKFSGQALNAAATRIPWLLGGDADLSVSTSTAIKDGGSFEGSSGRGANVHFGVREHAMAAVANGICYHGGVRPFVATFFCFADYMRPSIRLAAMNHLNPIYVWTHDSVWLGEDGPTHQPVEHLASLRAMPNMLMLRPADAMETEAAWKVALEQTRRPAGLVMSRQNVQNLDHPGTPADVLNCVRQGAYVLREATGGSPKVILIASGSEVELALQAQKLLESDHKVPTRVVSMPSWELFAEQSRDIQDKVLPPACQARVAVEAGVSMGWEKWIGQRGAMIGLNRFGASAPAEVLMKEFGFTPASIAAAAQKALATV